MKATATTKPTAKKSVRKPEKVEKYDFNNPRTKAALASVAYRNRIPITQNYKITLVDQESNKTVTKTFQTNGTPKRLKLTPLVNELGIHTKKEVGLTIGDLWLPRSPNQPKLETIKLAAGKTIQAILEIDKKQPTQFGTLKREIAEGIKAKRQALEKKKEHHIWELNQLNENGAQLEKEVAQLEKDAVYF